MKIRTIIITSLVTTVFVLGIVVAAFAMASPSLAQTPPMSQAPNLAASHLALPEGGGAKIWNLMGNNLQDYLPFQDHRSTFGCLYYEDGSVNPTYASATVHLPDGATMQWIRFYWRDWESDQNIELQLRRYPYANMSGWEPLATLWSYGTDTTPLESYTEASLNIPVDNTSFIYMVYANLHYAENDHKLCGIQIGYTEPSIFGAALPIIHK
ncbi:MAG: hypothetical protein JXR32_10805 [Anaerolineaceae bacterium]|nr:hypothetical protein [Anaerolineaceae bacterium]